MSTDGVILVDKPTGWTSHDVVGRMRRLAGTRKVGHAGTLDPMATGLLVLGVGKGTRLLTFLVGAEKDYTATIRLGQSTLTDDAEGEITTSTGAAGLDPERIAAVVTALTGDIEQVPSTVSAIKVDGRRAYARARAGEDVTLAARPVTVSRFDVLARRDTVTSDGVPVTDLDVEVTVSSGTYVRALARDLGSDLGTGGHLTALRRTRVGGFVVEDAHTLDALASRAEQGEPVLLLGLAEVARRSFAVRDLTEDEARALSYGARIPAAQPGRDPVAGIDASGRLIAMLDEREARTRSHVVFAPASS